MRNVAPGVSLTDHTNTHRLGRKWADGSSTTTGLSTYVRWGSDDPSTARHLTLSCHRSNARIMVAKDIDDHADFIFEVPPDPETFDVVRRVVVSSLRSQYGDLIADDIREHARVDTVELAPVEWRVEGTFDGDSDFGFDVVVDADDDATDDVVGYLRGCVDRRYGDAVDPEAIAYVSVSLRPRVWFVDAKISTTG